MTARLRNVAIPCLLHVDEGALGETAALVSAHGFDTRAVMVCSGGGPSVGFAQVVSAGLRAMDVPVTEQAGLTGQLDQAADLAARIISAGTTLAIAVGGGRVIDTVKLAAARTGTDFVSVPTTIAHDGISSPVASLESEGRRVSHAAAMPAGIVIDTTVIGSAPKRTIRAGVGDLVSNLTATLDWQLADAGGYDQFDAFSAMIAESAARPVFEMTDLETRESHEILAKGLLLSGLAMAAAGTSRPCSGAEHLISHSLDLQLGEQAALHGEQVALGCLISAHAHGSPLLPALHAVFRKLGLPVAPEEAGLTREQMCEAVLGAPATRPARYTVLTRLELSAAGVRKLVSGAFD